MNITARKVTHRPWVPAFAVAALVSAINAAAQTPTVADPDLAVRTVGEWTHSTHWHCVSRTQQFSRHRETNRPRETRRQMASSSATALDLPVNSASERGLLGIALHPDFRRNHWVYLFWTESSTGADSRSVQHGGQCQLGVRSGTRPPLGNRVDRFVWNWHTQKLTFDRNIVVLRAYQRDADQPAARQSQWRHHPLCAAVTGDDDPARHGAVIDVRSSSSSWATTGGAACCRT